MSIITITIPHSCLRQCTFHTGETHPQVSEQVRRRPPLQVAVRIEDIVVHKGSLGLCHRRQHPFPVLLNHHPGAHAAEYKMSSQNCQNCQNCQNVKSKLTKLSTCHVKIDKTVKISSQNDKNVAPQMDPTASKRASSIRRPVSSNGSSCPETPESARVADCHTLGVRE